MSIEAMNWAYQQTTGRSTAKAVLVALANQADQNGKCWPSVSYLMQRTEMGRRAVIGNIAYLEENGFIQKKARFDSDGSAKSNLYTLNVGGALNARGGADNSKKGVQQMHGGGAADAPKQSINNQSKSNNQKTIGAEIPDWIDSTLLADFIEHRKQMKKPMTDIALARFIPSLAKLRDQGHDPNECMERSIANGWQGVFPPDRKANTNQSKTGNDEFWGSFQ